MRRGRLAAEVLEAAARIADRHRPIEDALGRVDPILRPAVRRRALEAFADALVALDARPATAEEQLRLAGSIARTGVVPATPADLDAELEAAREATPGSSNPDPPRRWWWATGVLVVTFLALLGVVGRVVYRAYVARPDDALRRGGPRPGGAWALGGRPPLEPAVVRVFGSALGDWAIALSTKARSPAGGGDAATARERLFEEARAGLPEPVASRLAELVVMAERVASSTPVEIEGEARASDTSAFLLAVGRLDDALAAAGLGVWVDGDVLVSDQAVLVVVYSFAVDEIRRFRGGGLEVAALRVRRLDTLSVRHALVGFTRPNLREAVVLMDQLDGLVADLILPVLGDGGRLAVCGEAGPAEPARRGELEAVFGALARGELASAGVPSAVGARVAGLIARRTEALARVRATLGRAGLVFSAPDGLALGEGFFDGLEGRVGRADLDELAAVDRALGEDEVLRLHARVRAIVAASVERHEVQHRLDLGAGDLPMPAALAELVGPAAAPDGTANQGAVRARDELSAYTAELARDPVTTRVGLALVGRFLCDPANWGTAESNAAVVLIEGLARELGVATPPLVVEHRVDRAATIEVLLDLGAAPPASLRAAAGRLWQAWYERPLAPLEQVGGPPP